MRSNECLQLTDNIPVTAEGKISFDPVLDDTDPQLLQPSDLDLRELLVADIGQGRTAPQCQRLAQVRRRPAGRVRHQRATALAGKALETAHIDALPGGSQNVCAGPGQHNLSVGCRLQCLPEPGDVHVQRVLRARGRMLPPQPVKQGIAGHRLVRAEKENYKQRPLLLAADIEDMAVNANLNRPE